MATDPLLCRLPEPPRGPCIPVPLELSIPLNLVAASDVVTEIKHNGRDGPYYLCDAGFSGENLGFQFRDANGENLSSGYLRPGANSGVLVFQPALRLPEGGDVSCEIKNFDASPNAYQINYRGFKTYAGKPEMNPYASPVEQGIPDFGAPAGKEPRFYVQVFDAGDFAAGEIKLNQPFQITGGDFIWKSWSTTDASIALRFTDGNGQWRMNERIPASMLTVPASSYGVPIFPELPIRDRQTIYFDLENLDGAGVDDYQVWLIGERIPA